MTTAHAIRYFLLTILLAIATLAGAQSRTISTIAGIDPRGDGLLATQAALKGPWGVVKDAAGNLFISDFDGHAIRRVDAGTGVISTYAGTGISGNGGDGGPAGQAQLTSPGFLALAPNGDLYISDFGAHRVRKVDAATGVISHVAGNTNGTFGLGASALSSPLGIALNAAGDLFIADSLNSRIQKVSGGVTTTVPSFRDLPQPRGIAVDGADLLVVISQSQAEFPVILRLKPDGTSPVEVGSLMGGTNGNGPALSIRLNSPFAIALAPNGDLYFTEVNFNTLRRVHNGQVDTRTPTQNGIYGVVLDGAQALLAIPALRRVFRFDFDVLPQQTPVAVAGGAGFTGDGSAATLSLLQEPARAVQDAQGNVYIADTAAHRIRRIDGATGAITTFAGTGVAGFAGDGGDPLAARLDAPMGLALDAGGNLYVADSGNDRVRFINAAGSNIVTFAGGGGSTADGTVAAQFSLPFPVDIGFDGAGNLHVLADSGKIHRILEGSRLTSRIAGTGVAGSTPDGTVALSVQFRNPRGLAVSPGGDLYIADTGSGRVRSIIAGVEGTPGNIPQGTYSAPQGVALDSSGVLYIADTGAHRVDRLEPAGNFSTFGTSVPGFSGDGAAASSAQLHGPRGVFVAPDRRLLVADTLNGRVRAISAGLAQAIDFSAIPSHARTDPPFTVSATGGGSGIAVKFSSLTPAICTTGGTNGTTVTLTGTAGTCTIAANQAGNLNFDPAPQVTRSFAVASTSFTVTPSQTTPNGTISPSTPQTAVDGEQLLFTLAPDADYTFLVSGTCGGSRIGPDLKVFQTNPVHANCTVIAFFDIKRFVVTTSSSGNGNITPSGIQAIAIHGQVTYTVTPNPGHVVTMGGTCGGTLTGDSYTTNAIEADCTVTATFSPVGFTVTPSAGPGGTISPNTPQSVLQGLTRNFTITPGSAFLIDTVGGSCGGTLNGNVFTTAPVVADCTVNATFKDKVTSFMVTSTALSGPGSLDSVLTSLNTACPGGLTRVEFNIPAATDPGCSPATGICVIQTPESLKVQCSDTVIDGYTQPGSSPNTRTDMRTDARLRIELAGSPTAPQYFDLRGLPIPFGFGAAARITVQGIAFPHTQLGAYGANQGSSFSGGGPFTIRGNWFGMHADGSPVATGEAGNVNLTGNFLGGIRVGGPDPADRNLFRHHDLPCCNSGISAIRARGVENSLFEGNFVNVDLDGNIARASGILFGINLNGAGSDGLPNSRNNVVRRNVFHATFQHPIAAQGAGNTFSENVLSLEPGSQQTSISLNGIGNNNQAAPVIGAVTTGATVDAAFTLQSAPGENFRVEFFSNTQPDPNGFGRAERFVGAVTVTTNAGGLATGTASLPADARNMTATATRLSTGDTSEISAQHISQVVVTPTASGNGSIAPSVPQTIAPGGQVTFSLQPAPGHAFAMGGTCGGTLAGNSYTTNPVQADCTVIATFTPVPFTVTPSAGPGGNISPGTPQVVAHGQAQVFTITPGSAFEIDSVGGTCGGTLNGNLYTTAPVTADCTVTATFKDKVTIFTVTSTAVTGSGSLSDVLATLRSTCPGGLKRVEFNIPAATDVGCNPATGICVIDTPDNLGVRCDNTTVDGYTQPGATPNTRTDRGNDAQIKIELKGRLDLLQALALRGNDPGSGNSPAIRNVAVHGIAFPRSELGAFGGNTGSIFGGGGGFVISGNWFGFHADGTPATDGVGSRLTLVGSRIDGNRIGGPDPADRNLFTQRPGTGFSFSAITANGVETSLFEGNFINVAVDGTAIANPGLGNGFDLSNSLSQGTQSTRNNIVRRNVVLNVAGSPISNNGTGNTFTENVLTSLNPNVPMINGGDGNNGQAVPVFGTVTYGAAVVASGTLQSAPNEAFRIELFANAQVGTAGFGRAERFVGAVTVTSDASGLATWSVNLPADARNMTATATRLSNGDTSNLSAQHVSVLTVTASSTGNGTITPSGAQSILVGGQVTFAVQPSPGHVFTMGGTCGGNLAGNSYTTNPVQASCTVTATFVPVLFTVTPSAGAGGTISPSTPQSVVQGQAQVFTITPGAALDIDTVSGTCGGTLAGNTFTTAPVVADCTVDVTFKEKVTTYTVTTTAISGPGSLSGILATMNANCGGRNHIVFNIPAATDPGCNAATGICLVATPDLMRIQCFDTDLDGYTQPGASPNTRTDLGNNAQLRIELVAPSTSAPGQLELRGQEWPFGFLELRRVSVRGLALPNHVVAGYGFNSGSSFGGGGDYTIAGNWFGFHADGTPVSTGFAPGVRLFGIFLTNNRVGGPLPADRNRFTFRPAGVCCNAIDAMSVSNSLFEGNFFNVDGEGNAMDTRGINSAIATGFNDSFNNVVRRNVAMNTGGAAISMRGAANTVTENILVTAAAHIKPIAFGETNNGQVAPVFGNVTYAAGAVNASGTLQSVANESFRIEVFSNATARPGGFGSAERFVGAVTVSSDASGLAAWNIALPADARNMTATATRLSTGDSSELSVQHISPNLFTVTPSAGANGSITPSTPQFAAQGATLPFTLAPASGFELDAVGGTCGGTLNGNVFTTAPVTASCTVVASFKGGIDPPDDDKDGIPNDVEPGEGLNPQVKDNDIFSSARLFAMQQYRDFLGREGDAPGVATWTNEIASTSMTREQVIRAFFDSPEFQNGIPQMTRLYFAFFNRIPDYPGLRFHAGRYRVGVPLNTIAEDFAGSEEFLLTYGALTNAQYVDLVYENVLGRPADPGGRANALAQLDGGTMTRGELMAAFSESQEHRNLSALDVFVTSIYVGMLRRSPDPQGLENWVNAFGQGLSREQMLGAFMASQEYRNRFLP